MTNGTLSQAWINHYKEFFLQDVHTLLFLGHQAARHQINSVHEEEEITGFLHKAIKAESKKEAYHGRYTVEEDRLVDSKTRTGKNRRRIDLVFEANDPSLKREFCCEAKRLKTSTNTIAKYTGEEGLGCFVKCQYAQDQPMGAMLGYVQSSTMNYWQGELRRSLNENEGIYGTAPLCAVQIISELSYEWQSKHTRTDGSNIDIYHIFLECETILLSDDKTNAK